MYVNCCTKMVDYFGRLFFRSAAQLRFLFRKKSTTVVPFFGNNINHISDKQATYFFSSECLRNFPDIRTYVHVPFLQILFICPDASQIIL